jgi:hypothetical protein
MVSSLIAVVALVHANGRSQRPGESECPPPDVVVVTMKRHKTGDEPLSIVVDALQAGPTRDAKTLAGCRRA